jgi:uncharacterized protein (DUF924 family)
VSIVTPAEVLDFWFFEAGSRQWFKRDTAFDALCERRLLPTFEAAARGECWTWRQTPEGRCAEIILLDQLSRNLFRGSARAFAQDPMALALAQEAVGGSHDRQMTPDQRYFTYMPFMHSESLAVHDEAIRLFTELRNAEALRYEMAHRDVIARFGRYPARNAVLGRVSSAEESAFLEKHPGF